MRSGGAGGRGDKNDFRVLFFYVRMQRDFSAFRRVSCVFFHLCSCRVQFFFILCVCVQKFNLISFSKHDGEI